MIIKLIYIYFIDYKYVYKYNIYIYIKFILKYLIFNFLNNNKNIY